MTKLSPSVLYIITIFAILFGLFFSVLSGMEACTEACAEAHKYRLFGLTFSLAGVFYFGLTFFLQLFSQVNHRAFLATSLLLAAGLGAEIVFIIIQKMNGSWCPLCLSITVAIIIASLARGLSYTKEIAAAVHNGRRPEIMRWIKQSLLMLPALLLGIFAAFTGVYKVVSENVIVQKAIEEQIVFGDHESPMDVYVFTSWTCPACRRLEPKLERMVPDMFKKARVTFVDFGEDMTTLNFLPYNLSFMLNNKSSYIELRHLLGEIAENTGTPSEEQIEKAVRELGSVYKQLNYSEIVLAIDYFKDLAKVYKIQAIPAVVIVNKQTKEQQALTGIHITAANVRKALSGKEKEPTSIPASS